MQSNKFHAINSDFDIGFLLDAMPGYVYWKDLNSVYQGCNFNLAQALNFSSSCEIIGKTDYDFSWSKEEADQFSKDDKFVIETGQTHISEYILPTKNSIGLNYVVRTEKKQLIGKSGKVIGVLAIAIDVAAEKEAERLQIESEKHKTYVEEQNKFVKIVGQMAHDIRSPISTLKTVVQTAHELAEQNRITLRHAVINIEDITNHMLTRYKPSDSTLTDNNQRQYVLASGALSEIASERRYRYQNSLIEFEFVINDPQLNNFVFIQIEPSNLNRMISNLINNAVESLPKTGGKITLKLLSDNEWVEIIIADNGKGMSRSTLDRIREGNSVNSSKKNGFGIGLTQVFDAIKSNLGEFNIFSNSRQPNRGTIVRVRFPKSTNQPWLATEIKVTNNDIIIIIDDDTSIHNAWDMRFSYILEKIPTMQIKHFMHSVEALEFINNLNYKYNVCLLSDYELIKQSLNGLDIIKKSGIKRSVLVTSHYANSKILKLANQMAVKILPKDLVYSVPIRFKHSQYKPGELAYVHMVLVDDEIEVTTRLIAEHYSHLLVDAYQNPFEFLQEADKYPKNTKIIIDNNYHNNGELIKDINGTIIAKQLHDKGYTNLYIYSWEKCDTPDYVTLILKTDRATIEHLDQL